MTTDNQGPSIDDMFPQVNLTEPTKSEPTAQPEKAPLPELRTEMTPEEAQAMKSALFEATLESLSNSMEITLACAMARVAFLGVAGESEEPKSFVTQTIAVWIQGQKAKFEDAPAELKIQVWEKLEGYARAQEARLLEILEGQG